MLFFNSPSMISCMHCSILRAYISKKFFIYAYSNDFEFHTSSFGGFLFCYLHAVSIAIYSCRLLTLVVWMGATETFWLFKYFLWQKYPYRYKYISELDHRWKWTCFPLPPPTMWRHTDGQSETLTAAEKGTVFHHSFEDSSGQINKWLHKWDFITSISGRKKLQNIRFVEVIWVFALLWIYI